MNRVVLLVGVPRDYAWGSTTAIAEMLGREPDGTPLAELWFGAHPDAPAIVPALDTTLDTIAPDLPFLVKLLAAERPLSIQVHPDKAQAVAGFDREEALGIPRDAPHRRYRDANHKPELICALTEFEALCGFRPVEETLRLLSYLDVPALRPVAELLESPDGLRAAFTHLLTLDDPAPLVRDVVAVADAIDLRSPFAGPLAAVLRTDAQYPGDAGVLVSLLLNFVQLQPGEAIYLGAGNVHAYLRGLGVEIMATSDNVLRAGLTPKHVDVDELLAITDFTPLPDPRWPRAGTAFDVPVPDFRLLVLGEDDEIDDVLAVEAPRIVLVTGGDVRVLSGGSVLVVPPGAAAYVPPGVAAEVAGHGTAFVASVGD